MDIAGLRQNWKDPNAAGVTEVSQLEKIRKLMLLKASSNFEILGGIDKKRLLAAGLGDPSENHLIGELIKSIDDFSLGFLFSSSGLQGEAAVRHDAKVRLCLIRAGFTPDRVDHLLQNMNPMLLTDLLLPNVQARAFRRESLQDIATNKWLSLLSRPEIDDVDYVNLFLQGTEELSMFSKTFSKPVELLIQNPSIARTAAQLAYPGVDEPEPILKFRTIWPFIEKKQVPEDLEKLLMPVIFDDVLGSKAFVDRLSDSFEAASKVAMNKQRCLADLLPMSALVQYDEFFLDVNPSLSGAVPTSECVGEPRPETYLLSRVRSFKISEDGAEWHFLLDTEVECWVMVKDQNQVLLAPASRKMFFRSFKSSIASFTYVFDDSSLIPHWFSHPAGISKLVFNLETGEEVWYLNRELLRQPLIDVKTGDSISMPQWLEGHA